jgi:phosphoserine phosphatase
VITQAQGAIGEVTLPNRDFVLIDEITANQTLCRLEQHQGGTIVDLDETLYLHNSTEDFIRLAQPSLIAAYLLRLLDMAAPWRFVRRKDTRDNWRLLLVVALFPWTLLRWRRFCRKVVPSRLNRQLVEGLRSNGDHVIVATNGFRIVIKPMMNAFGLEKATLVACRLLHLQDRANGKLALLKTKYDDGFLASSIVITDSRTDTPLLQVCAVPCLTQWTGAIFDKAFKGVAYVPGDYITYVKKPRMRASRKLVREDLLPWVIVGLSTSFTLSHILGLICLFYSMWAVYEVGYYDNDITAKLYESDPQLTSAAVAFDDRRFPLRAWGVALALGLIGSLLVARPAVMTTAIIWLAVLCGLQATYWLYNRMDKATRVWLYVPLQAFRRGAVLVVVSYTPVVAAIIASEILAKWIEYLVYRLQPTNDGYKWPAMPYQTIKLVIALTLLLPPALTGNWSTYWTPAIICLPLFAFEAWRLERRKVLSNVHRLDRPSKA